MRWKSLKIILMNLTLSGALWAQAEVINITSPTSGEVIDTSIVTVSFTLATYFAIGDSACQDCDGYIKTYLNDNLVYNVTSSADFDIMDVIDGNYMLKMEAVDPVSILLLKIQSHFLS